jgi:Holliday junction resolvasome RuvABC ATP-dependent DNA helicase subunit
MPQYSEYRYSRLIGQSSEIARLREFGDFYATRGMTPGHILITGQDGMGQARMARTFASELNVPLTEFECSDSSRVRDMASHLANMQANEILFLRNLQALRKVLTARLLKVLLRSEVPIRTSWGNTTGTQVVSLPPFTLIATCPQESDCPSSLRDEFPLVINLAQYAREELARIAIQIAAGSGVKLQLGAGNLIAQQSDGRPGSVEEILLRILRAGNHIEISEQDVQRDIALSRINKTSQDESASEQETIGISEQDGES